MTPTATPLTAVRLLPAIRWTVALRLSLGLALILALFAAGHVVSQRAAHTLEATLSEVVSDAESRRAAADEMKLGLEHMTRAAASYDGKRDSRDQVSRAQAQVERALQTYAGLASAEQSRVLAQRAMQVYGRYRDQAHRLA